MRLAATRLLAAVVLLAGAGATWANGTPLSASRAWVRWLPDGLPAAGYVTIKNDGTTSQRLTNATSSDYHKVMLHRSVRENGVDRMIEPEGIDIAPDTSVSLAPGGYHLMLMDAKHSIVPGQSVTFHLVFATGITLDVRAEVKPASAADSEIK